MNFPKLIVFLFFGFFFHASYAGISLGATRVVISDGKNEGSINVHNKENGNYLIQSWVLDKNENETEDFVLTPPLFKLNGNTSNSLRVLLINNLPQDKESLFWLNVKFIPSTSKNEKGNKLTIAINNQIKLIYRPESISKNEMISEFKKIGFKKTGNDIKITNPTKYYMNFSEILIGGKKIESPSYIAPESEAHIKIDEKIRSSNLEFVIVDDLGKLNSFKTNI